METGDNRFPEATAGGSAEAVDQRCGGDPDILL